MHATAQLFLPQFTMVATTGPPAPYMKALPRLQLVAELLFTRGIWGKEICPLSRSEPRARRTLYRNAEKKN
jgi:hypothetical protein